MFTQDPGVPSGSVREMRAQSQLDRISSAPKEQVDLGGQPGMESFEPRGISEAKRPSREQMQATDEGYAVLPPGYEGPFDNHVVIRTLSDGSRVIDPARTIGGTLYEPATTPKTPQEMRDALRAERLGRRTREEPKISEAGRKLNIKDALSTREMDDPILVAKNEAKILGLNPDDFENLGELQWAITRRTTQETMRTGRNPLVDPAYDPTNRPEYKHRGLTEPLSMENIRNPKISEAFGIGKKTPPPQEEMIGMQLGNREDILRNQRGQYAEHGARVANKELLQNAIDALTNPDGTGISGGQVKVTLDHHSTPKSITVEDNGPGIPYEALKNEYITLTGSGKRGKGKFIGEMGVGKATYLLGAESFDITSTVKEANGETWQYNIKGNPEDMIKGTTKLTKQRVADGTPTGTKAIIHETDVKNMDAAADYLRNFSKYSNTPVDVVLKDNKSSAYAHRNLNETVPARTIGTSQFVASGSAPGGDYKISIPDNATWNDKQGTTVAIISNRGMFQGAETIYPYGYNTLPDRVLVEIDPTVDAQNSKYPLTSPTRERMKDEFRNVITKEVNDKVAQASRDRQQQDLKTSYDNLNPIPSSNPKVRGVDFVIHDSGEQYTPQELQKLNNSPRIQAVMRTMDKTLNDLDQLFPTEQIGGKTKKYGMLVASEDRGGVNVPNPGSSGENAVLVNILGSMEGRTPKQAAQRITHLIMHEFNHNLARSEGGDFTWKLAEVHTRFDLERQVDAKKAILAAITDSSGNYAPEIQDLLQEYKDSRGRPNAKEDLLYRSATGGLLAADRQAGISSSRSQDGKGTTPPTVIAKKQKPPSTLREAFNLARGATSTADLSAALRQGLGMITRKEWWTSWNQQLRALGSEAAYQKTLADIKARPLFESKVNKITKKVERSWGDQAGLKIMEAVQDLGSREESTASNWIETGGMFGKDNVVQKTYQGSLGRFARASNRAYTAFLNQLRADSFESLLKDAYRDFQAGTKGARNPYTDLPFAKEIADYVNTATGRGPMRLARPTIEGGKLGLKESNFEYASRVLTDTLFSPRLIFSRLRMLNPATYAMASPFVRKQYLRSALGIAGAWSTVALLAKGAGADVSMDPDSADFGKIKIGDNTRLDPMGGFQQYFVAMHRLISGRYVSSASGAESELGQGYRAETGLDVLHQFGANKLHPVLKFAHDLLNASTHQPFSYMDRTAQLFIPLIVGDVLDLAKEDPSLLPLIVPTAMGMGTQVYEKGETQNKFIAPEHDFTTTHGISDLNPMNWGQQDQ